jgi:hypothetical protein
MLTEDAAKIDLARALRGGVQLTQAGSPMGTVTTWREQLRGLAATPGERRVGVMSRCWSGRAAQGDYAAPSPPSGTRRRRRCARRPDISER